MRKIDSSRDSVESNQAEKADFLRNNNDLGHDDFTFLHQMTFEEIGLFLESYFKEFSDFGNQSLWTDHLHIEGLSADGNPFTLVFHSFLGQYKLTESSNWEEGRKDEILAQGGIQFSEGFNLVVGRTKVVDLFGPKK